MILLTIGTLDGANVEIRERAMIRERTRARDRHGLPPTHRAEGLARRPIGQASLYVFIVHIYVVALVSNVLPFHLTPEHGDLWINTLGHTVALAILWLMVRYKVLYRWIPR